MYTLSIILNLHQEKEIVTKTIQNLEHMLNISNKAEKSWENIELIAILDSTDEITKSIIEKNSNIFTKIEFVNYKELSSSRNHGVRIAANNFILFADGDDYFAHETLVALYYTFSLHYSSINNVKTLRMLNDNQHIAIFPKHLFLFPKLHIQEYTDSNALIVKNMMFSHCYTSRISCPRIILQESGYRKNSMPYGYEDWDLNNRLLAKRVQFKVADNYVLYYRVNNLTSLLCKQIENKCIVRNSLIYTLKVSDSDVYTLAEKKSSLLNIHLLRKIKNKLKHKMLKIFNSKLKVTLSNYNKYLEFLNSYGENDLSPDKIIYGSCKNYAENLSDEVKAYYQLQNYLLDKTVLYIVPHVELGGADKVIIEHAKAIKDTALSCGVITSIARGKQINLVSFKNFDLHKNCKNWDKISVDNQLHILVKAIINSGVKLLHVIQSNLALQMVNYYGTVFKENNIKIIVSLFCPDYDWANKQYFGYPLMYPGVYNHSDIILSDNQYWYQYFKKWNFGVEFNFKKLAVPAEIPETQKLITKQKTILWASRFCRQKLVEVFYEIAKNCPQYKFVVYTGSPESIHDKQTMQKLCRLTNVEINNAYHNLNELNFTQFDLLLYTSLFDGIPNIVIEMAAIGMPIIASNICGINEVLGKSNPLLVSNCYDINEYIKKIELFYSMDEQEIFKQSTQIQEYLKYTHTHKKFSEDYLLIINNLLDMK